MASATVTFELPEGFPPELAAKLDGRLSADSGDLEQILFWEVVRGSDELHRMGESQDAKGLKEEVERVVSATSAILALRGEENRDEIDEPQEQEWPKFEPEFAKKVMADSAGRLYAIAKEVKGQPILREAIREIAQLLDETQAGYEPCPEGPPVDDVELFGVPRELVHPEIRKQIFGE